MAQQRELTLPDYVSMIRRRWVLIVALAIVGTAAGYLLRLSSRSVSRPRR